MNEAVYASEAPGQIGIAVYSPRLDSHGNSVRGVAACRELSKRLELHFLHVTRSGRTAEQAPELKLALLERLAAGAYAQMDAAVRAIAVRGGDYRVRGHLRGADR
jgi:hypothetical protein